MNRLLNYWLFTNPGNVAVAASTTSQVVAATAALVPVPARSFARLVSAYMSLAPTDTSGQLTIAASSLLLTVYDQTGAAITSIPLPAPSLGGTKLPALANGSIRVAANNTPERIEVVPAYEVLPTAPGKIVTQVGLQAILLVANADATNPHSINLAVGGIIGVGNLEHPAIGQ